MKVYYTKDASPYFDELEALDSFAVAYPFTATAIPEGIDTPKYNWKEERWEDASLPVLKKEIAEKAIELIKQQAELIKRDTKIDKTKDALLAIQEKVGDMTPFEALFKKWAVGQNFVKDELVIYEGTVYRYIADNDTVSTDQLNPKDATYLWTVANVKTDDTGEVVAVWVLPTGYQNAYKLGDIVEYSDGKKYESLVDGNTQEPTKDEPNNRYWKSVTE